jgi:hypothetical protein
VKAILPDILRRVQTSPAESLVLQTIAYRANVQGQNARISYEALAAATDFSEQWVKQLVKRLEEKHLLRVHRQWIGYAKCAVNRYDIIRPWLRELSYAQAYARKQETTAQMSRQGSVDPNTTKRENKEQIAYQNPDRSPCSHEECLKIGLTPGTDAYRASRGMPESPPNSRELIKSF